MPMFTCNYLSLFLGILHNYIPPYSLYLPNFLVLYQYYVRPNVLTNLDNSMNNLYTTEESLVNTIPGLQNSQRHEENVFTPIGECKKN